MSQSAEIPRLSRLTAILTQLQSKRVVTATEISERFGISIRTAYRDIRALEEAGVPILTEEGKGYSLMEGYRIPPVMFSEEEANALITAAQLVRNDTDRSFVDSYENAILKIKAVLQYDDKEKVDLLEERVEFRQAPPETDHTAYVSTLQRALTNLQVVHIRYHALHNDKYSTRNVEPFALFSTHGNWVMIAWCRLREDYRYFRLDRIGELKVMEDRFPPHNMSLQQYFDNCRRQW